LETPEEDKMHAKQIEPATENVNVNKHRDQFLDS